MHSSLSISWTLAAAVATTMLVPKAALAQEASEADRAAALALAVEAHECFEAGEPEAAVELLLRARTLYREPLLLYNLARAYEAQGQETEALAAYEGYVAEQPAAEDRAAVEVRIGSLRETIAERERLGRERESERRRRAQAEERAAAAEGSSPSTWVLGATGATTLATGTAFAVVAVTERDNAAADPVHATTVTRMEEARTYATVANVLFVAGGVVLGAGLVWLIVDLSSGGTDEPSVEVAVSTHGVDLRGVF